MPRPCGRGIFFERKLDTIEAVPTPMRSQDMQPLSVRRAFSWLIFLAAALTAIGLFFIPAYVILPFHRQTAAALTLAMDLRQRAPRGTLTAAVICVVFGFILWPPSDLWRKIVLSAVLLLVAFSTVMARLNYFEWMFHPVDSAKFDAEAASKLDKDEMILALRFGDDARAYPISEMAYHHVLNDVVDGVPVAVTY